MAVILPDQSVYTGFIPKDLYEPYLKAYQAGLYAGKPIPYHYYQYYGIPYKVSYANPYQLIDYVDKATALPIPGQPIPGVPIDVPIVIPPNIKPPAPGMDLPGQGIPQPVSPITIIGVVPPTYTPSPINPNPPPTTTPTPGTDGFGSVQAWAMAGIALAMAVTWGASHRRKSKKRA